MAVRVAGWVGSSVGRCDGGAIEAGFGNDDPSGPSGAGEGCWDRAEKRSVIVGQLRLFGLAPQDAELVAEHDDLEVLRAAGARRELCQ